MLLSPSWMVHNFIPTDMFLGFCVCVQIYGHHCSYCTTTQSHDIFCFKFSYPFFGAQSVLFFCFFFSLPFMVEILYSCTRQFHVLMIKQGKKRKIPFSFLSKPNYITVDINYNFAFYISQSSWLIKLYLYVPFFN